MKKQTNRDGFDAVVAHFGNQAELARALNVERASVSVWKNSGIPYKYIPRIKELTGLRGSEILPELARLLD